MSHHLFVPSVMEFTLASFVLQALLTGVAVVCARDPTLDPYEFIADKLRELQAGHHEDLSW